MKRRWFCRMGKQTVRFFDPVEETLEKIYKDNVLEKKDELPLDDSSGLYLMPNGDYWQNKTGHANTIEDYLTPNQNYQDFLRRNGIIHIHKDRKENNRLDFVILAPITPAQLRTIYRTDKDVPDLWITYDVVDMDKPFSVSGEGYREMLADLRKKNYLPKERDSKT